MAKGHTPGIWRLVVDFSNPHGRIVNDGINPKQCSLSYFNVDVAGELVTVMVRGTLMAKIIVKSVYRMITVHPEETGRYWGWNGY